MPDPASHPYAVILEECARAAPAPWYPSAYAEATGTPRDDLDAPLNDLRVGGLIRVADWVQGRGQGYQLTPAGQEVLHSPRRLEQLRGGRLPVLANGPPGPPAPGPVRFGSWDRGEAYRRAIMEHATPFVTFALFAANVLWFFAGMACARHLGVKPGVYLSPPVAGAGAMEQVFHWEGAIDGPSVVEGHQWWRLLTAAFVHIGWIHILGNMVSLLWVGPLLERLWGHWRFLTIYLVSAFTGNCGMLIDHPTGLGGGASTALWGILAALVGWLFLHRRVLPPQQVRSWTRQLVIVFAINFWLTYQFPFISKGGHFGGGIGGLLVSFPLDYLRFGGRRRWLGVAGVLAVPVAAAATLTLVLTSARAEQTLQRDEIQDLNDHYVNRIASATAAGEAACAAADKVLKDRGRHAPDPEDVRQAETLLRKARARLDDASAALQAAGPYRSRLAREDQRLAMRYMERLAELLQFMEKTALRDGDLTPEDEQRLHELEDQRTQARERWEEKLKPPTGQGEDADDDA